MAIVSLPGVLDLRSYKLGPIYRHPVASKPYVCASCDGKITPGERYTRVFSVAESSLGEPMAHTSIFHHRLACLEML
jgi:hypothetical protein